MTKTDTISSNLFTIREFCEAVRISPRHFFRLQAAGDGPRTISLGGRKLIMRQALEDWLDDHEN